MIYNMGSTGPSGTIRELTGPTGSPGKTGPMTVEEREAWRAFLVAEILRLRAVPEQKLLHGDGGLYGETELAYHERLLLQNFKEAAR